MQVKVKTRYIYLDELGKSLGWIGTFMLMGGLGSIVLGLFIGWWEILFGILCLPAGFVVIIVGNIMRGMALTKGVEVSDDV
jgi:hypothetical protein